MACRCWQVIANFNARPPRAASEGAVGSPIAAHQAHGQHGSYGSSSTCGSVLGGSYVSPYVSPYSDINNVKQYERQDRNDLWKDGDASLWVNSFQSQVPGPNYPMCSI